MTETAEQMSKRLGAYETPPEATEALLKAEIFTPTVWDCCCGRGQMAMPLQFGGYDVFATDIHDWGFGRPGVDFLQAEDLLAPSVCMNPPFPLAVEFVLHALRLGARKVAVFQRLAWWEGGDRTRDFWDIHPPQRKYTFDKRVSCWRFDVPEKERRERGNTPTAHAWFVWEQGQPAGTLSGHLRLPGRRRAA